MNKTDDYPTSVQVGTPVYRVTVQLQPDRIHLRFARGLDTRALDSLAHQAGLEPVGSSGCFRVQSSKLGSVRSLAKELLHQYPGQVISAAPVFADRHGLQTATVPMSGAVFVRFRPGGEAQGQEQLTKQFALVRDELRSQRLAPYHAFRLKDEGEPGATFDAVAAASELKAVEHAELDWTALNGSCTPGALPTWGPNDPLYVHQWHLQRIRMPEVWSANRPPSGPLSADAAVAAIIDNTGFWLEHPDLGGVFTSRSTHHFFSSAMDPPDPHDVSPAGEHGTLMAGLIATRANNGIGVAGVASGCRVLPVKPESLSDSLVAEALDWVIGQRNSGMPVAVVNMSFSLTGAAMVQAKLDQAWDAGLVLCASAGNYDPIDRDTEAGGIDPHGRGRGVNFPAAYRNVIAVGATDKNDFRKYSGELDGFTQLGSRYGTELDVVAPGMFLVTTDLAGVGVGRSRFEQTPLPPLDDGRYTWLGGNTSGACALVSGLVALIRARNGFLRAGEVRDIIGSTCRKVHRAPDSTGNLANYYHYGPRPTGTTSAEWPSRLFWNERVGYGLIDAYEALGAAGS